MDYKDKKYHQYFFYKYFIIVQDMFGSALIFMNI